MQSCSELQHLLAPSKFLQTSCYHQIINEDINYLKKKLNISQFQHQSCCLWLVEFEVSVFLDWSHSIYIVNCVAAVLETFSVSHTCVKFFSPARWNMLIQTSLQLQCLRTSRNTFLSNWRSGKHVYVQTAEEGKHILQSLSVFSTCHFMFPTHYLHTDTQTDI